MTTIHINDKVFHRYMLKHDGKFGEAKSEIQRIVEQNAPDIEVGEDD